jgi:hypothetical protein
MAKFNFFRSENEKGEYTAWYSNRNGKYIFLNLETEEYVLPSNNKDKFIKICKDILKENKLRKEMDYADNIDIANGFPLSWKNGRN